MRLIQATVGQRLEMENPSHCWNMCKVSENMRNHEHCIPRAFIEAILDRLHPCRMDISFSFSLCSLLSQYLFFVSLFILCPLCIMVFFLFSIVAHGYKPVPRDSLQAQPSALNGTIKFDQLSKGQDVARTQVWQNPACI